MRQEYLTQFPPDLVREEGILPSLFSSPALPISRQRTQQPSFETEAMNTALRNLLSIDPKRSFGAYIQASVSLLSSLSKHGSIAEGRALHAHLLKLGVSSERCVAIRLLVMYLNRSHFGESNEILKQFNGFDVDVHNCLVSANVKWGNLDRARKLFDEMPVRNVISWTTLISGFMGCGRVGEAVECFERNPFRNLYSWTVLISGFVRNGLNFEALEYFCRMIESGVRPDEVTITSVVKACAEMGGDGIGRGVLGLIVKSGFERSLSVSNALITLGLRMGDTDLARTVFGQMEKKDVVSWTAILDMYVEMGDMEEARRVFDAMPERNEVSWSAMIARYSQNGFHEESANLFLKMVQLGFTPSASCFSSVLSALASLKALRAGTSIHSWLVKIGIEGCVFITSSLIDLYCKCGNPEDGRLVFESSPEKNVVAWNSMVSGYSLNFQMQEAMELFNNMPFRNTVSWNAIISGYVESKQFDSAFEIFNDMLSEGQTPSESTLSTMLCASASTASLDKGRNLHGKALKLGIQNKVFVGTALADMYAKSGDINSCRLIFHETPNKNEVSWAVMIQGLAENGFAEESLKLFEEMEQTSSIPPNEVTLLSVLFACSHSSLVEKGLWLFNSMERAYGLKPKGKHYTAVVDMLARAGRVAEAEEFINGMPFEAEPNAWAALLSGCCIYGNQEIAERAAVKLSGLVEKPAGYILLSNVYASAGRWSDVLDIRELMKSKGLKTVAGCSWVEVRDRVYSGNR